MVLEAQPNYTATRAVTGLTVEFKGLVHVGLRLRLADL
jgi:hypothetical protein